MATTLRARVLDRWRRARKRITEKAVYASVARVPFGLERLSDFRAFFQDELGLYDRDLTEDEFSVVFQRALRGRDFSVKELQQWFRDIDVDCSDAVSWDEFSTFILTQTRLEQQLARDMDRARDLVPDTRSHLSGHACHRMQVERVVTTGAPKFRALPDASCPAGILSIITASHDGQAKLWTKEAASLEQRYGSSSVEPTLSATLDNSSFEQHSSLGTQGSLKSSAIVDARVAGDGHLFILGADRTVNVFHVPSRKLVLRYRGYPEAASRFVVATLGTQRGVFASEPRDGVALVRLLDMDEFPTALEIARPGVYDTTLNAHAQGAFHGDELFFFGMQDGSVLAYETERHALRALRRPLSVYGALHTDRVHMLLYHAHVLGGMLSASWDGTCRIFDVETKQLRFSFDGVAHHFRLAGVPGGKSMTTCGFGSGELEIDVSELRHHGGACEFALNVRDHVIATVAAEHDCLLWSPTTGPAPIGVLRSPRSRVIGVAFSERDQTCMTLDQSAVVRVWDLRTNTQRQFFHVEERESAPPEARSEVPRAIAFEDRTGSLVVPGRSVACWTVRHRIAASSVHNDTMTCMCLLDSASGGGWVMTADTQEVCAFSVRRGVRRMMFVPFAEASTRSLAHASGGTPAISAMGMDRRGRRLFIADKTGHCRVFNARTGMLLGAFRPKTMPLGPASVTSEVHFVVPLSSADNEARIVALVTTDEVHFVYDSYDRSRGDASFQNRIDRVFRCEGVFKGAALKPPIVQAVVGFFPENTQFVPLLLIALGNGTLVTVSPVNGSAVSAVRTPQGGYSPRIEEVLLLRRKAAMVMCFEQSNTLEFWNARYMEQLAVCKSWPVNLRGRAGHSFTCLGTDEARNEFLFAGDESGCVFVFDLRALSSNASARDLTSPCVRLVHVFRAHTAAIVRIAYADTSARVVTQSASQVVRCSTPLGKDVGFFGPAEPFHEAERGDPRDPLVVAATLGLDERNDVPSVTGAAGPPKPSLARLAGSRPNSNTSSEPTRNSPLSSPSMPASPTNLLLAVREPMSVAVMDEFASDAVFLTAPFLPPAALAPLASPAVALAAPVVGDRAYSRRLTLRRALPPLARGKVTLAAAQRAGTPAPVGGCRVPFRAAASITACGAAAAAPRAPAPARRSAGGDARNGQSREAHS